MKKAEIVIRLRKMPESLVGDDIYPLLRVTFVNREGGERITLMVGATVEDDDEG